MHQKDLQIPRRHVGALFGLVFSLAVWLPPDAAAHAKLEKAPAKPVGYIRVEVLGQLKVGVVAIGGETTGTTITANGITWELDFGKNASLRKAAAKMNGKTVVARGTLTRRAGVEIRQRWIVTVRELVDPKAEVTTAQMKALAAGVQVFYIQHRQPPKTLNALVQDPGGLRRKWRPLLESTAIPKDAWGSDFKYFFSKEPLGFTIISAGADREFGTGDDIKTNKRF